MSNLFTAWTSRLFRGRSANRDAETDHSRVETMARSLQKALKDAEAEHSGLNRRIGDVLAQAAIALGNGSDEYLTREPMDTHFQNQFDREIVNGQRRLEQLSQQIDNFKFVQSALETKFPDYKIRSE